MTGDRFPQASVEELAARLYCRRFNIGLKLLDMLPTGVPQDAN